MKTKFIYLILTLLTANQSVYCQRSIIGNPKSNSITVMKTIESDLTIPIEIDFINKSSIKASPTISISIENSYGVLINRLNNNDLSNIKVINNKQLINIDAGATVKVENLFYLFIDRAIHINCDKIIYLKISEGTYDLNWIKITIQPDGKAINLDEYLTCTNRLDYVTKVESNNNILTINGYKKITDNSQTESVFLKRNISLRNGQVLAVSELSYLNKRHWHSLPLSILTIPFKIRPEITSDNIVFRNSAGSGITNLGLNLDLVKYQIDRYFATGKKSSHKFSFGFWAAPAVEELDSVVTNGYLPKDVKSKQLFVSTGLTISYSYNDISFVFVPLGWDIATSTTGKSWVYNTQRWWGFGIAISPKIFETILNK